MRELSKMRPLRGTHFIYLRHFGGAWEAPQNELIFEESLGRQKSMDVSPGAAQGGQKGPRVFDVGSMKVRQGCPFWLAGSLGWPRARG